MSKEHKSSAGWVVLIIIVILLILAGIYIFSNSQAKQVVCGTHAETYTTNTNGCDQLSSCSCIHKAQYTSANSGCDSVAGCTCLHKSWLGLGSCDSCSCIGDCDSCQCTKEVSNC